ncbi:DUF1802 family protein [Mycobacterium novum]
MQALKEWSAVVAALLGGRQRILLRKGGIHEKRFEVAADEFLLFPTAVHSHAKRVRPEHRDLLTAAAGDSTGDHVLVRAAAKVVARLPVERPEALEDISDLHIWTAESVRADRLDFRPRHRLTVLVVQAIPLVEPVRLPRTPDYAGCSSWVRVPLTTELAAPVADDAALRYTADRVFDAVG